GACFALSLLLTLDHRRDPREAGQLAAFVQGVGFLINAVSPWMTGWLRELTGSFVSAWVVLAVTLLFGAIGWVDDYRKVIEKNSRGLPSRWKYFWQSVFGL
ncbi:hypothetical protein ACWS7J_29400, partial [Escherichia coli]